MEHQRDHRCALNDLNQSHVTKVLQQRSEDQRTADHTDQQHQVEQRHNPGTGVFCRKIRGERQARGLCHMHAQSGEEE